MIDGYQGGIVVRWALRLAPLVFVRPGELRAAQCSRGAARHHSRQEGERSLILRLLTCKVGDIPQSVKEQIECLSVEELEALGEALLGFEGMADLQAWLVEH
jgi:hypothetical protein